MWCLVRLLVEDMRRYVGAQEAATIDGIGAVFCRLRIMIVFYPCREEVESSVARYLSVLGRRKVRRGKVGEAE